MTRHGPYVLLACCATLAGGADAQASDQFSQSARVTLSAQHTNKPMRINLDFQARDPGAPYEKPMSAKRIIVQLPRGTRYDPGHMPACDFNEELNRDSCTKSQLIGGGFLAFNFRPTLGDAISEQNSGRISIYNATGGQVGTRGMIMYLDWELGLAFLPGVKFFASISRHSKLTIHPPYLVPQGGALTRLMLGTQTPARRNPLLRSPRRCPRSGKWKTSIDFIWEDDTTGRIVTKHRCRS